MKKENKTMEALTRVFFIVALAAFLLTFAGFALASETGGGVETDAGIKRDGPDDKATAKDAPALEGRKERQSYALGMVLGNQFRDRSVEVDPDLYIRGLKDALAGRKTLLTQTEAQAAVNAVQSELKSKPITPKAAGALTDIKVSFKLDPRLTRAQYMGDRWVSQPTFTSTLKVGTELTVEARAHGLDAGGRAVAITPEWVPADPGMVTVSPDKGKGVEIIVKHAGESRLKVASQGVVKELLIKAMDRGDAMQVEISQ
jgi:hypothetical protein